MQYIKENVAARLTPHLTAQLNENYQYITGTSEQLTFREFIERLFAKAMQTGSVPTITGTDGNPVSQDDYNYLIKALKDANKSLADLNHQLATLQTSFDAETQARQLSDNQVICDLSEFEHYLLKEMAAIESKRTEKTIFPQTLLVHLFKHQVTEGSGDWLPKIYSGSELRAIKTKLTQAAAASQTAATESEPILQP